MGLDVVVGVFGEFDEVECEEFAEDFAVVRRVLAAAGLPDWAEPSLSEDDVLVYEVHGGPSGLDQLRRVAAHLAATGAVPPPVDREPGHDPVLKAALASGPGHVVVVRDGIAADQAGPASAEPAFDHLIQHSGREGYYVPVDFPAVLHSEDVLGGYLGSSQRLLEECLRVAEALALPIDLDPEAAEVQAAVRGEAEDPVGWRRHPIASYSCLQLIGAAWHSIKTGAAITFC